MPSAIVQPPKPGFCCHCGQEVPADQHLRQYAIEGVGISVPVTHCDECVETHESCAVTCSKEK